MEIYCDTALQTRKKVSFEHRSNSSANEPRRTEQSRGGTGTATCSRKALDRKPLTPHNKLKPQAHNRSLSGKKQARFQNSAEVGYHEGYGKENQQVSTMTSRRPLTDVADAQNCKGNISASLKSSRLSSLRRNLRGTMSPSIKKSSDAYKHLTMASIHPAHDEGGERKQSSSSKKPDSKGRVPLESRDRNDGVNNSDQLSSPSGSNGISLLNTELNMFEKDESLLISPEDPRSNVKGIRSGGVRSNERTETFPTAERGKKSETRRNGIQMDLSYIFSEALSKDDPPLKSLNVKTHTSSPENNILLSTGAVPSSMATIQREKEVFESKPTGVASSSPKVCISYSDVKNHVCDNNEWAEKQCISFTKWLNYTFHPTEDDDHETSMRKIQNTNQTTTSSTALRTLMLHQRMTHVRLKALKLFNGEEMTKVQTVVREEVSRGRISIREDRDMYADLSLRENITSLLMSYSIPWLRLGLETLFGETISPELPTHTFLHTVQKTNRIKNHVAKVPLSPMKLSLKKFIVTRVLSDPATLRKYTKGKCRVPSGNFERKYRAETRKLALYRLLVLIIYLDRAKLVNVTERVPHLFVKEAMVKSSREVLVMLCRDFLSAEGDIIKHLSRIGLRVSYKQEHIDEIDFTVTNLAVDLRDGVRLARLIEILRKQKPKALLRKLRLPAVSRLQKLHNVGVVLDSLVRSGVPNVKDIFAHHIVDGHREVALELMWSVVSFFQFESLLDAEILEQEIRNVRRANQSGDITISGLSESDDQQEHLMDKFQDSRADRLKSLLRRWCQAVCSRFGTTVENFTTSFADGKVVCLLLHYYHPKFLQRNEILPTTRDLLPEAISDEEQYNAALNRERQNSALANLKISEIGGVPAMVPMSDSENVPEERSVLLCLAYLCSRLIESSKEISATIAIQGCYRLYRRRVEIEEKKRAATTILEVWRENKDQYYATQIRRYKGPVCVIENFYFTCRHKLRALRTARLTKENGIEAATVIQKLVRRMLAIKSVKLVLRLNHAARCIQSNWRAFAARRRYFAIRKLHHSSVKIQCCWRRYRDQTNFLLWIQSIVAVQSCYRSYRVRRSLANWNRRAVAIQRMWRGFLGQVYYEMDLMDIIVVQSLYRRNVAMRDYRRQLREIQLLQRAFRRFLAIRVVGVMRSDRLALVSAVVLCQSVVRRHLVTHTSRNLRAQKKAATNIQKRWRSHRLRREFCAMRQCAVFLQASFRAGVVRRAVQMLNFKASVIQSFWKGYWVRHLYRLEQKQLIIVQSTFRRFAARRSVRRKQKAVLTIQTAARCWRATKSLPALKAETDARMHFEAVVVCQSIARRFLACQKISAIRVRYVASMQLQKSWRGYRLRTEIAKRLAGIVSFQALFRGEVVRRAVAHHTACATILQSVWRGYWTKLHYQLDLLDIIIVQSAVRRSFVCRSMSKRKSAAHTIQRSFRFSQAVKQAVRDEQSLLMGMLRRSSATELQAFYRGHIVRRDLEDLRSKVITVQRMWRGRSARFQYRMDVSYIVVAQGIARRKVAYNEVAQRRRALHQLQLAARRWRAFRRVRAAAEARLETTQRSIACIMIQRAARRMISRIQFNLSFKATLIQKTWRRYIVNVDYMIKGMHILTIQSHIRCYLQMRGYRKATVGIVLMQALVRGRTKRKAMRRLELFPKGVIQIQSVVRGYLTRLSSSQQAKRIAMRIEQASYTAGKYPTMSLGQRTASALDILQTSTRLTKITEAMKTLETTTRLSEQCCTAVARRNAPEILYAFIPTCNRSLPHVEHLRLVLLILLNLAKYPHLLLSLATDNSVDVLIDVLQMFRDKKEVFGMAASMLGIVAFCREELQERCRSKEKLSRLKGIYDLVSRNLLVEPPAISLRTNRARANRYSNGGQQCPSLKHGAKTLQDLVSKLKNSERCVGE